MPCEVGSTVSATRSTRSWRCRQATRSAMVSTGSPSRAARATTPGIRVIEPSSSTSSPMTPTGGRPASRQRSTAASVCPGRTSTPPARARSGTTCPGRRRSAAVEAGSARTRAVARPVGGGDPRRDAHGGVDGDRVGGAEGVGVLGDHERQLRAGRRSRPSPARRGSPTCAARSRRPRRRSGSCAARTTSPSFSRSASSTTRTGRPSRRASRASSTVERGIMPWPPWGRAGRRAAARRTSRGRRPRG